MSEKKNRVESGSGGGSTKDFANPEWSQVTVEEKKQSLEEMQIDFYKEAVKTMREMLRDANVIKDDKPYYFLRVSSDFGYSIDEEGTVIPGFSVGEELFNKIKKLATEGETQS